MNKILSFYVIKLEDDKFYRRNHESNGGMRPTTSLIRAEQYAKLETALKKYNELLESNVYPKPKGVARFGLLNGELIKNI